MQEYENYYVYFNTIIINMIKYTEKNAFMIVHMRISSSLRNFLKNNRIDIFKTAAYKIHL